MTPCLVRLDRLRRELAALEVQGMWVTNLTHVRYLSGFTGSTGMLLVLPERQYFCSDGRYLEQARREVRHYEIHIDQGAPDPQERPAPGLAGFVHRLGLLPDSLRLAYDGDHVSVNTYERWREIFPSVTWVATSNVIDRLAMVKDEGELAALREAVRITDEVFQAILPELKAGAVEAEIAARISFLIRQLGGEGDSFEPIVASGWRSALPHARPSGKAFEPGDFVILDFGARYGGYHADMTRTVCIGPAGGKHHRVYRAVLEAQLQGIKAVSDGARAADIDAACRSYLADKGYAEAFTHSTGHGIGLEVHTPPRLARSSDEVLRTNMVVTIEPGIYLAGWGGVRIEDDVLVGPDGGTPLNRSGKDLVVAD